MSHRESTEDVNRLNSAASDEEKLLEELPSAVGGDCEPNESEANDAENEGFFNMLSHVQRNRMDDQRCILGDNEVPSNKSTLIEASDSSSDRPINELLDMLADKQGQRLDDQRVTCDNLPGLQLSECYMQSTDKEPEIE
ncbi:Purkinje cell protein 2-like isoform X2 [Pristis pectinata]|uniref:Purkinje cell protein 2-like isoform X2 n=1 Tax=Pristis pectinata TaxID=685728 RepID=UPI00223CEB23|nr:Purkinje cell protein 2-like isoform X2 [Pristis pectinata]